MEVSGMTLWICGQVVEDVTFRGNIPWEFQGVFDSEEKAVAACVTPWYFVAPYTLNEPSPHERTEGMDGSYYPLAPKQEATA